MAKTEINYDEKREHDVRGPTAERISKADNAYVVGGKDRGVQIYFFADTPLQRLYARLRIRAGDRETDELTSEYTALMKYRHHWHHAGLEASVGSIDFNRVHSSDPSTMSGMAKSERQYHHRTKYREAVKAVGHKQHILLENFACYEHPLHVAAMTIGYSTFRARKMVRSAAQDLCHLWGIG